MDAQRIPAGIVQAVERVDATAVSSEKDVPQLQLQLHLPAEQGTQRQRPLVERGWSVISVVFGNCDRAAVWDGTMARRFVRCRSVIHNEIGL
ncbi:hypothetical protein KM043_013118 [Ampulex compressa]|nr:hypothetical protein KM043_013118 [Ampulex compressa]